MDKCKLEIARTSYKSRMSLNILPLEIQGGEMELLLQKVFFL